MTPIWLLLPLLLGALFGALAPQLARHLPPQVATPLLSVGGLVAAAGSATSLALVAYDFVAQAPVFADRGGWSDEALRSTTHVAPPLGVLATTGVAVTTVLVVHALGRRMFALRDARRLALALPGSGELSVAADAEPQAFAVPGRPGRILVTTGLLARLTAAERRALLAHERAHLDHRHHLHQAAASIAAAANPMLRRLPAAVALGCERWADEEAARTCSREAVAAALVNAALGRRPAPSVLLAAAGRDVAARLGALQSPPPRLAVWRLAVLGGLLAAVVVAVALAMHDTERLFDLAEGAYRAGQR